MSLQTDPELNQNEIASINKKYNVLHYNKKLNERHTVAAEQKIRELKIRFRNLKRLLNKGKLKPNDALKKRPLTSTCYPLERI